MREKYRNFVMLLSMCICLTVLPVSAIDYKNSSGSSFSTDSPEYIDIGTDITQGKTAKSGTIEEEGEEKVDVYATRGSSFSVVIPKVITLDGASGIGNYQVAVKGELTGGQCLSITTPDVVQLYEQSSLDQKDSVSASISGAKTFWTYKDVSPDDFSESGVTKGMISAADISSGSWSGNFLFNIELSQEAPLRLVDGKTFNQRVKSLVSSDATFSSDDATITRIEVTQEAPTTNVNTVDLAEGNSNDKNYIIGYLDGSVVKLYTNLNKVFCGEDAGYMFFSLTKLESIDFSAFNFTNIKKMEFMFYNCTSLKEVDLIQFNTEQITKMGGIFAYCQSLTDLDLRAFDTSKTTTMDGMFCGCTSLKTVNLSNFNTENVTDMNGMFGYCTSLKGVDVSSFNTKNVAIMYGMFGGCSNLSSLKLNFDTSSTTDMGYMFCECPNLMNLDLGPDFVISTSANITQIFRNMNTNAKVYATQNTADYLNQKQSRIRVLVRS